MLDAVSALILTERDVDVGLDSYNTLIEKQISFLCTNNPEHKSFITDGRVKVLDASLKKGTEPLLFSVEKAVQRTIAYRYENQKGERFLVFLFECDSVYERDTQICLSGLVKNYAPKAFYPIRCLGLPVILFRLSV